jgi:hypothetical protein
LVALAVVDQQPQVRQVLVVVRYLVVLPVAQEQAEQPQPRLVQRQQAEPPAHI